MPKRTTSKPPPKKRDPNIPVLSFKRRNMQFDILFAGPGEFIDTQYKGAGRGTWTPNSIVVRERGPLGFRELEQHPYDPDFWNWIGVLIADRDNPTTINTPPTMQ